MTTQYNNLPQIKSIWIDEDEEAEKLYGLQAQQMMDSDEEEQFGVVTLNSEKPILENKQNIELPPLPPSAYELKKSKSALNLIKKKNKLMKLFKNKNTKDSATNTGGGINISVPFAFQHISHANGKNMFGPDEVTGVVSGNRDSHQATEQRHFSKAFVTDALPSSTATSPLEEANRSRRSISSSLSVRSSNRLSRVSTSMSTSRVLSTSTMATSMLIDTHSSRPLEKLSSLEKVHLEQKANRPRTESSVSIGDIKNYNFPTLLEECIMADLQTPDKTVKDQDKFVWDTCENAHTLTEQMLLEQFDFCTIHSPVSPQRRKSDSLLTPVLNIQDTFEEIRTPIERRSVDDDLLYYHQHSESESTTTCRSRSFSFVKGSPKLNHNALKDKDRESHML